MGIFVGLRSWWFPEPTRVSPGHVTMFFCHEANQNQRTGTW